MRQAREKRQRLPISLPGIVPACAYSVTVTLLIRSKTAAPLTSSTSEGGGVWVGVELMVRSARESRGEVRRSGEIMNGNWL